MGKTVIVAMILAVGLAAQATDEAADFAALTAGVTELTAAGVPGPLCVVGPGAFPVVVGGDGLPVIVAARWVAGRVVALGHGGFLSTEALGNQGNERFARNAVTWLAAGRALPKVVVIGAPEFAAFLKVGGATVVEATRETLPAALAGAQVLVAWCSDLGVAGPAVVEWVKKGGGWITSGLMWGWLQLHPGLTSDDHDGNRLLAPVGIAYADGTSSHTTGKVWAVGADVTATAHAVRALDALLAAGLASRPSSRPSNPARGKATPTEAATRMHVVSAAARAVSRDDPFLWPRLVALTHPPADSRVVRDPGRQADPLLKLKAVVRWRESVTLPAGSVRADPEAWDFPGLVPPHTPRVEDDVAVDCTVEGRHGTALYAPPGGVVRVTIPADAVKAGLHLRIGAHSDTLWGATQWKRFPEITRVVALTSVTSEVATPFGGLIYLEVGAKCALKDVVVHISGGVRAARFVAGVTTPEAWRSEIRHAPAPWAELESARVVLTLPASAIRTLDDPAATMAFWDRVLDACADLATIPHERKRPERYVADLQISAGYMHSGYPIMTHLDVVDGMAHPETIMAKPSKGWGFFHEMGHNHQRSEWTFDGTGEVTCNLFSLYVSEMVCGATTHQHDAVEPEAVRKKLAEHLAKGAPFAAWKSEPFLALAMYSQLQRAFGWDAYKQVFAVYRALPAADKPHGDDAERDQWMVRFSRVVGHNLGPFFVAWGVPTSEAARESIKDLPAWMPVDWPVKTGVGDGK